MAELIIDPAEADLSIALVCIAGCDFMSMLLAACYEVNKQANIFVTLITCHLYHLCPSNSKLAEMSSE